MAMPSSRFLVGSIPWYSTLIVLGMALAIWLATLEEKRLGLPKDTVVDLSLIIIPCGIIGARIYYVAMSWDYFRSDPLSTLFIWEGGMAIYGGVIGGLIGGYIYARKKKLSFLRLADSIAPGLLLAQAIGRWGNYFNKEAYGPVIADKFLQFFPFGVLIPTNSGQTWHMATFFYESVWNVSGFLVLWLIRKNQKKEGNLFCWYLLLYGSGRFIIEQLRQDSLYIGTFRASQMLSLLLCAGAGTVLLFRAYTENKRTFGRAIACLAFLIARWAMLDFPIVYGVCAGASMLLAFETLRVTDQKTNMIFVPFLIDMLGLGMSILLTRGVLATALHTLLCSCTLPLYVGLLVKGTKERKHAQRCT